ncbi:MAG: hypothetical protein EOO88_28970 [Pedobacter sp.]|nr:MAG: hypothetical protein EOO88_28970 [Pedobacter sp.]
MSVVQERQIRQRIIDTYLSRPSKTSFRLIEELDLCLGDARIDMAVFGSTITGIEIKSDSDTLSRLPRQIEVYGKIFERIFIYVGSRHVANVMCLAPEWWGVIEVAGSSEEFNLILRRKAQKNLKVDKLSLTQLLWKEEVIPLLSGVNCASLKYKNRHQLWEMLSKRLSERKLKEAITTCIKARVYDSIDEQRKLYDGLCRPSPM